MTHPMSIGETAANGVNHTPSGTDSGEENISEVLANAKSSSTREGFIAPRRSARMPIVTKLPPRTARTDAVMDEIYPDQAASRQARQIREAGMREMGLNPNSRADIIEYAARILTSKAESQS